MFVSCDVMSIPGIPKYDILYMPKRIADGAIPKDTRSDSESICAPISE